MAAIVRSPQPFKALESYLSANLTQLDIRPRMYWAARHWRESLHLVRRNYGWDMGETGRWTYPTLDRRVFVDLPDYVSTSEAIADQYHAGRFSQRYADVFESTLKAMLKRGVRIAIFDMPPSVPYVKHRERRYAQVSAERHAAYRAMFERLGIPLIRCETSIACGLDERIFADPVHMNDDGARRVSEVLAEELLKRGIVTHSRAAGAPR